jgi:hypothetical protein
MMALEATGPLLRLGRSTVVSGAAMSGARVCRTVPSAATALGRASGR